MVMQDVEQMERAKRNAKVNEVLAGAKRSYNLTGKDVSIALGVGRVIWYRGSKRDPMNLDNYVELWDWNGAIISRSDAFDLINESTYVV